MRTPMCTGGGQQFVTRGGVTILYTTLPDLSPARSYGHQQGLSNRHTFTRKTPPGGGDNTRVVSGAPKRTTRFSSEAVLRPN